MRIVRMHAAEKSTLLGGFGISVEGQVVNPAQQVAERRRSR
jgi:hypothetical protein